MVAKEEKSLEKVEKIEKSPLKKLEKSKKVPWKSCDMENHHLWKGIWGRKNVEKRVFAKRQITKKLELAVIISNAWEKEKLSETVENIMKHMKRYWLYLNTIYNKIYKLQLLFTYNTLESGDKLLHGKW